MVNLYYKDNVLSSIVLMDYHSIVRWISSSSTKPTPVFIPALALNAHDDSSAHTHPRLFPAHADSSGKPAATATCEGKGRAATRARKPLLTSHRRTVGLCRSGEGGGGGEIRARPLLPSPRLSFCPKTTNVLIISQEAILIH